VTPGYFNPLDRRSLGKSVAEAVLESPAALLQDIDRFDGAGIYVIYYVGPLPLYEPIASKNHPPDILTVPIYIGKAMPKGARKGDEIDPQKIGTALYKRLREHLKTLVDAKFSAADFWVRCLIVDDIWIPLGETMLIRHFRPLWNSALDGFGNHTPGKGRFEGAKPDWHVMHPGVPWADKCARAMSTVEELKARVREYFKRPERFEPHGDPDEGEAE
jgi:hypothetical protein